MVGPSFKDMAGKSQVVVVNGADKEVIATDDYIRESIFNPNKEIVKGYPSGLMQPYTGQISDEEMVQLMEYFKSLSK